MTPTPWSPSPVIAILLCATATAACSATADSGAEEPALGEVPTITSSSQIRLPLARYLASAADEKAYFAAVSLEQRHCASSFGVTSHMPVAEQPAMVEMATERRYGIVNADEVERYGYQPVPRAGRGGDAEEGWDPDQRELLVMNAVTAEGESVVTDPVTGKRLPEGGCSAEGFRRITEGELSPATNTLAEDLLGQAWERTKADSRAIAAETRWADCMRERGYDFDHRWEAGNSVGEQPLAVQLEMAKLDLRCALDTNYLGVWYAVDAAYQHDLIDRHESDLEATLAEHRSVMARVTRTLEGGS